MLPGQIGLLILGLICVIALAVMIMCSVKTCKKEERLAARRAAREQTHQAMQDAQSDEATEQPVSVDEPFIMQEPFAVQEDLPEPPKSDFDFKF